jgi:hypothetical protein
MIQTNQTWAYDRLLVEPGSASEADYSFSMATEHALAEKACTIAARGAVVRSPNATGALVLRIAPISIDQAQGRYSGYGVQLHSILWTASIRAQLIEPNTQKILNSFDEATEERQIPSSNGSQDLSALATEGQLMDNLIRSLGRQLATRLVGTLKQAGICGTASATIPTPSFIPPEPISTPIEVIKQDASATQVPIAPSVIDRPEQAPIQPHALTITDAPTANRVPGEYRVALVIGNAHYDHIPTLSNPSNDARFISEQIVASGFELVGGGALLDLTKPKIERAIADFGRLLSQHPGAVGFFYYAGHGIQVNGSNFLVPTDANPSRIADLSRQAIEVDSLLQEMEDSRTGLNIIVLDACRNNPFGGRGIRESGAGLAQMRAPRGSIIVYATQPGNIAQDGPSGQNSPFAKALAYALADSELDLFGTFNEVGLLVANATGGEQQPWISSSPISGRFCFKGCPK